VTFAPGVFFWFFVVGGLTVVMAGGVSRVPVIPRAGVERAVVAENPANSRPERTLDEPSAPESGPESAPEPEPPPPVAPAPDAEDLEDLMFVDADIEAGAQRDGA
jgi:hypothetical protein